jgi:hypothetical protein
VQQVGLKRQAPLADFQRMMRGLLVTAPLVALLLCSCASSDEIPELSKPSESADDFLASLAIAPAAETQCVEAGTTPCVEAVATYEVPGSPKAIARRYEALVRGRGEVDENSCSSEGCLVAGLLPAEAAGAFTVIVMAKPAGSGSTTVSLRVRAIAT